MWTLGFVLIVQGLLSGWCHSNVIPDQIFTENGRPIAYPTDEDIADQLIGDGQVPDIADVENWRKSAGPEDGSDAEGVWNQDFPDESNIGKATEAENEKQEKQAPIRKRQGQEEFATFVDPFPNKRLVSEKQVVSAGAYEKRAQAGEVGQVVSGVGNTVFIAVATVCTAAAVFGLIGAAYIWRRVHNRHRAAGESEYPAYGVTGPAKERSGNTSPVAIMDAKLASSAQLYHYQHTKQQIIAMEQSACESKGQDSEDSEGEEDEGDFSVYEYPGLAPTGDIEVSNPLFENASPLTKTDPKLAQLEPRIHQRPQDRGEDQ